MLREELKWRPHESESTDAERRGGLTRSSDEVSVIEMERRG
jgi:RNA-directed DNA polymerase